MKERILKEVFLGKAPLHLKSIKESEYGKNDIKKTRKSRLFGVDNYVILKFYKSPL